MWCWGICIKSFIEQNTNIKHYNRFWDVKKKSSFILRLKIIPFFSNNTFHSEKQAYKLYSGETLTKESRLISSSLIRYISPAVLPEGTHQGHITSLLLLPEGLVISLIMSKYQMNPNCEAFYKIISWYSSTVSRSGKKHKNWAMVVGWRKPKRHSD